VNGFPKTSSKLLLALVCIVLAACSSGPVLHGDEVALESLQRIRKIASDQKPRMLLRVTNVQPIVNRQGDIFLPEMYLSNDTARALTSPEILAFPGGGGILVWPTMVLGVALVKGAETFSDSSQKTAIERCNSQWNELGNIGAEWADRVFGQASLNKILEDDLRLRFSKWGLDNLIAPIALDHPWTHEDIAAVEGTFRASESFLIIGDVRQKFDWGLLSPELSCGIRLTYEITLYGMDLTPASDHPFSIASMLVSVGATDPKLLKALIADPDLARNWVGSAASELAAKITDLYFMN
jgi:hypothetical protein